MAGFPWVKAQDFWLRLGLLKALLSVLPQVRKSSQRDQILRELVERYFVPAMRSPELFSQAEQRWGDHLPKSTSVARALLLLSDSTSWGQPIDRDSADDRRRLARGPAGLSKIPKILEWASALQFMSSGYKVAERGVLLRSLFPEEELSRFKSGDLLAWNPFSISATEKAFFLFHLGEMDAVLLQLAFRVGLLGTGAIVHAAQARSMCADALEMVIGSVGTRISLPDLSRYRTAKQLLLEIRAELQGNSLPSRGSPRRAARRPDPGRKTTKRADHETIPRFEQLIDLGFLEKPESKEVGKKLDLARKSWTFRVTNAAVRFADAVRDPHTLLSTDWLHESFATTYAKTGVASEDWRIGTDAEAMAIFFESYDGVKRPVGHTPFESVALMSIVQGIRRGIVHEISQLQRELLRLKATGLLGDSLYFAAGNTVDRMFLLARANAAQRYAQSVDNIDFDVVSPQDASFPASRRLPPS